MTTVDRPRAGGWLQTYTGRQFWPLDARPEEIDILDIAHALSCQGRFAGHTRAFYSVAQHSVEVSIHCAPTDALWGLLHDASEAYLVDLPTPIKHDPGMQTYRYAERWLMEAICQAFGLPLTMPESVTRADRRMLATEQVQLIGPQVQPWQEMPEPLNICLLSLSPVQAELAFLSRFEMLKGAA
jgi:uncharacterized protein